jgi:predicted ester cyclase
MTTTHSAGNIDFVSRHYEELLHCGDLDAADRDLSPDFVDHSLPPGKEQGPEGAKAFITMVRAAFPDIRFTEEESIAFGDMVGLVGCWRGTHEGSFLGIEATGRSIEMRGIVLWRIADGRLAERWAVLDYDSVFEALLAER